MEELQKEKGLYYPYIMQILGCPVINGVLICNTSLKYLYNDHLAGVLEILSNIYIVNKNDKEDCSNKLFKKISVKEFKDSVVWAISDLFYGGCEPEDFDEEKVFKFLDDEEKIYLGNTWDGEWVTRKKYKDILVP